MNHPFVDGNKRSALYLAELLIRESGYKLNVSDTVLYEKFVLIADRKMDFDAIREWMQTIIVPKAEGSLS